LALILVNQGGKSATLSLELADAFHNDSQQATFGHSHSDSIPNPGSRQGKNCNKVVLREQACGNFF
jgi:hypothetical protein